MQARARKAGGWTVDAFPYAEEDRLASIHTITLFDVSPPDGPFIASSRKIGPFSETWFAFAETISPLMFGLPNSGRRAEN